MESLIVVKQAPVIEERLRPLMLYWNQKATDAQSMACTEETIKAVKEFRAEMRKEFDEVEALRKQAKMEVLRPYEQFEATYKDCITDAFKRADEACSSKIHDVESEIKHRCEDGLREYFDELCAAHGIDWLKYEDAGIKVDMASAKQKTPKKLREQLVEFVERVDRDVSTVFGIETIPGFDGCSDEIMAEYKRRLNLPEALSAVQDRRRRIEAERQQMEQRAARKAAEAEAVRKVEALSPPTVQKVITVTFTVTDTSERLIVLREWMKANGYKYQ